MVQSRFKYILIIGLFIWMISCDFIGPIDDLEPQNKLVEDNLFNDVEKTESALNGVYVNWRNSGFPIAHLLSMSGILSYTFSTDFSSNVIAYDNEMVKQLYQWYYVGIQRANFVIEAMQKVQNITGLSDVRRLEIEGEARIQRAMMHLGLLEYYAQFYDIDSEYGIVLMMKPVREISNPKRNTVQEVYNAILEDLDFGLTNAPSFSNHYRMSQTVAKAYKAKVLLYMRKYSEAANVALEAMADANYNLEETYADIFNQGYNARECLFSPFSFGPSERSTSAIVNYTRPVSLISIADAEVDSLQGDPQTGEGFDNRYAFAYALNNDLGGFNMKYPFTESNGQQNSIFVLRMTEVYLIYAEAKARISSVVSPEALTVLNQVRERAKMYEKSPQTKAELLEAIRIEKILELFGEWNQPWLDLVRYHINGDINISDIKPEITSNNQLILPIPKEAMGINKALIQNPGYEEPPK